MTVALLASVAGVAGCGGKTDLRYRPGAAAAPLAGGAAPSIAIGRVSPGAGIVLAAENRPKLKLSRPVEDSIKDALGGELRRLGFGSGVPDAVLNASLSRGEVSNREETFKDLHGTVSLTLSLSLEDRRGMLLWTGELAGVGDIKAAGSTAGAVNAALADAMKKIWPSFEAEDVLERIRAAGAVK
jgi:hypothetical protein